MTIIHMNTASEQWDAVREWMRNAGMIAAGFAPILYAWLALR